MSKRKCAQTTSDKICSICGDKANGRNLGAITCEPCKGFFRRAMNSAIQIPNCSFDNNCKITPNNRKSCKKCRLDKCFAVGMRKELIKTLNIENQGDSDHKSRICSDKTNVRQQNQCHDLSPNGSSSEDSNTTQLLSESCVKDSDYKNRIHSEKQNARQYQNLSPNGSEDSNTTQLLSDSCLDNIFPDMSNMSTELDLLVNYCLNDEDIPLEIAELEELLTKLETSSATEVTLTETTTSLLPIVRPINTIDKPLNDLEISRLQELIYAFEYLSQSDGTLDTMVFVVNSMGQWYQEMGVPEVVDPMVMANISFCKNISLFQEICEEDKLILFKDCSWIIMAVKYMPKSILDINKQTMTFQYNNVILQLNLANFNQSERFNLGLELFENIDQEWIQDPILINLLMAICLFNCELPDLTHRENIKLCQRLYLYLIQRYLSQKLRSEDKSSQSLCQLMKIASDLHQMYQYNLKYAKNHRHLLSRFVQEVYDI